MFIKTVIDIWLETAPWFLLGMTIAGLLYGFVPTAWVVAVLGKRSKWSVVKAALVGAPLPLCSCSVIPVGLAIRNKGASKGATTSFFVSTPETGVDSVSLTYALLGPMMAIIRPVSAIISAIIAGWLVDALDTSNSEHTKNECQENTCSSCCATMGIAAEKADTPTISARLSKGAAEATAPLLDTVAKWLVGGVVAAAAIMTFLPEGWLQGWGHHPLALFVMLGAGIPMYVCASASTPLAAGMLVAGVSPGAVLVFLLAGPATNLGTIGVIKTQLGNRALLGYLTGVGLVALAAGFLTNLFLGTMSLEEIAPNLKQHSHGHGVFVWVCGVLLAILVARSLANSGWNLLKKLR